MLLAIDSGNTNVVFSLLEDGEVAGLTTGARQTKTACGCGS